MQPIFCLDEEDVTYLGLLQLRAEGTAVSWVPGVDHLSGPLYTEVFRPDIPKGLSQPNVIFFGSKVQETT